VSNAKITQSLFLPFHPYRIGISNGQYKTESGSIKKGLANKDLGSNNIAAMAIAMMSAGNVKDGVDDRFVFDLGLDFNYMDF
jgi:hypothetical protein